MKKYAILIIFGFIAFYGQVSYAQDISDDILANEELMKNITAKQLKDYIAQGADVNAKGRNIVGLIMGKDIKIVKSIVNEYTDEKAETKGLGNSGISPLMYALKNRNFAVIKMLLDNGADVNAHDSSGNTVLMYACRFNADKDIVKMLIRYGANVNARDNNWKSVLMYASQNDNIEILKILIQSGANVNAKMEDGTTALIIAAQNNPNVEITKFLLDSGADIDARVMLKAVHNINSTTKNIRKKQKAIKATTNIDMKDVTKKAVSWYAMTKGFFMDEDEIKEKTDSVADKFDGVEQIYNNALGKTVLMVACENINPEIIAFLLSRKIDINAKGPFGMTALMYACDSKTSSDVTGIKTLLEHGADTKAVNEYGETALDYLKDNNIKKENSEYWNVFEIYNKIYESDNSPKDSVKNDDTDNSENTLDTENGVLTDSNSSDTDNLWE